MIMKQSYWNNNLHNDFFGHTILRPQNTMSYGWRKTCSNFASFSYTRSDYNHTSA